MIAIGDVIVSDEVMDTDFVCNLSACKGACCVEGDGGAPVEEHEVRWLKNEYENISPYLTDAGRMAIAEQGVVTQTAKGFATPLIDDKACAFIQYEVDGTAKCGIEQAFNDGATDFHKPVSCHLYPIRVNKYLDFEAVNYNKWEICDPACSLGKQLRVPVYKFVKQGLIRKYGKEFYAALEQAGEYRKKQDDH